MFIVNYNKVINSDYPSCIKLLAIQAKDNGYTTPGAFFKGLSSEDVNSLMVLADKCFETQGNDQRSGEIIMLLTVMLMRAEGIDYDTNDNEQLSQLFGRTTIFITTEALKRKGLVEVFYRGFTFDLASDEVIAKPVQ